MLTTLFCPPPDTLGTMVPADLGTNRSGLCSPTMYARPGVTSPPCKDAAEQTADFSEKPAYTATDFSKAAQQPADTPRKPPPP